MALVSHVCVRCAATPTSPKSPSSAPLPDPMLTKVILPKKKPMKWSTGVAPGEYGGPPTTTKLRKYWGGDDEDPLATDDFMWNKDFVGRFKKLIEDPQAPPPPAKINFISLYVFSIVYGYGYGQPFKEEPLGFLSLNRVMSLNSLEVDLSKELAATAPVNHNVHKQVEAETDDVMFREIRQSREDPKVLAAQAQEQYDKLKKLQVLNLGIGGIGLVSAYVSYTPEIAASFGAGFLGSLVYIRMLGSSVDSLKTDGAKALVNAGHRYKNILSDVFYSSTSTSGAIGQPRLLVPVVLVMVYNRWNAILVPEFGSMHLELIPMLVGFFTYKIATFVQAIEDAITVATRKT